MGWNWTSGCREDGYEESYDDCVKTGYPNREDCELDVIDQVHEAMVGAIGNLRKVVIETADGRHYEYNISEIN